MDNLKDYGSDSDSCDGSEEKIPEDTILEIAVGTPHKIVEGTPHKIAEGTPHKIVEGTPHKIVEGTPHKIVEGTPHKIVEGTPHKIVEGTPHKIVEGTPHKIVEGTPHKIVEGTPHKIVEGTPHKIVEGTSHKLVEGTPHKIVEGTPHKIVEGTPHKIVEGTPHKLVEGTPHKIVEGTPHKIVEGTPHKLVEGTPHKIVERTPHKIVERTPHKIVEGTPHKLVEGTPHKIVEGTPHKIVEGTPHKIVERTPHKIVEGTPHKIVEGTPHKIVERTPHKIVEGTPHKIVEGTSHKIVEGTSHKIVEGTPHKLVERTPHKIVEGTSHKLVEGTPHKIVEGTSHKIVEGTPHKIVEGTSHKIAEGTPHKIVEGTPHKIVEGTPHKIVEGTPRKIVQGTPHKIVEGTSHKIVEGTSHKIVEGTSHKLFKAKEQNLSPLHGEIQSEMLDSALDTEVSVHRKEMFDSSEKPSTLFFNFLGLEKPNQTKSHVFSGSQTLGDQSEVRKVQTNWGEVEIPNGNFWADFQPDCTYVAPTHNLDNSEYHTVQVDKTLASKSCIIASSHLLQSYNSRQNILQSQNSQHSQNALQLQRSLKRVHHCNNSSTNTEVNYHNKHTRPSDQSLGLSYNCLHPPSDPIQQKQGLPNSSKDQHNHQSLHGEFHNSLSSQPMANEKRKLFYIHSKVAPFVNTTPTNKCASRRHNSWPAHDGVVNRLAWNIPSFSHLLATAGMDTSVKVWNVWSSLDLCVARLSNHRKAVKHVEWCQTGRKVLSCSYDRTAQVTDVETARVLGTYEHMGFVTAGHIHPSNPNLFVTGTDNLIVKWDMRTPQAPVKHFSYKDKFGQVQDLLFINNGQEFVSCSDLVSRDCADRSVMVWDLRVGTVLSNQIYQELYVCTRLKIHPNSSAFLAQSHAGYVALFSTSPPYKMDKSKRYEGHKVNGHSIGFDISPDGTVIYSGSAGNDVHCYHQNSSRLLRKLPSKNDIITDVACHPVLPSCLASCTWGGSVSVWM